MAKRLLFVGPKTPPENGYGNITMALAGVFREAGVRFGYLCTIPRFAARLNPGPAWRGVRAAYLLALLPVAFVRLLGSSTLYISLNGGIGLLFDAAVVALARLLWRKVYLHHNAFGYLYSPERFARLVFSTAGPDAMHVVNCACMSKALKRAYGAAIGEVVTISNTAILNLGAGSSPLPSEPSPDPKPGPLRVGFMGYLSSEKGIDLFAETIATAHAAGVELQATAVGPVHDKALYDHLVTAHGEVLQFEPPKYGPEKDAFFARLDVLLFPSKYRNEAEPLIICDALRAGVTVLATNMGCIPEVLAPIESAATYSPEQFRDAVAHMLTDLAMMPPGHRAKRRQTTADQYAHVAADNITALNQLLDRLKG